MPGVRYSNVAAGDHSQTLWTGQLVFCGTKAADKLAVFSEHLPCRKQG